MEIKYKIRNEMEFINAMKELVNLYNPIQDNMLRNYEENHKIKLAHWGLYYDEAVKVVDNVLYHIIGNGVGTSILNYISNINAEIFSSLRKTDAIKDLANRDKAYNSITAILYAYAGWLISPLWEKEPRIWQVEGATSVLRPYPYQSGVDLYIDGFLPVFDGLNWRLYGYNFTRLVKCNKDYLL